MRLRPVLHSAPRKPLGLPREIADLPAQNCAGRHLDRSKRRARLRRRPPNGRPRGTTCQRIPLLSISLDSWVAAMYCYINRRFAPYCRAVYKYSLKGSRPSRTQFLRQCIPPTPLARNVETARFEPCLRGRSSFLTGEPPSVGTVDLVAFHRGISDG